MLKKVSHIILSLLLVVSTVGLTFSKHFCSAQLALSEFKKHEHVQHSHKHVKEAQGHNCEHDNNKSPEQICAEDESCCENETCHDDNCCRNEIVTIKLSSDFIKEKVNEIAKTYVFTLFESDIVLFDFNRINKEKLFRRYLLNEIPPKIANEQSFLQSFLC